MTNYVKLRQFCEKQTCSISYELEDNQVLAPMLVWNYQMILDLQLKKKTLKYLRYGGVLVQVAFIPVEETELELAIQCYYHDVNEYLKDYRKDMRKHRIIVLSLEKLTEVETDEGVAYFDFPEEDTPAYEEFLMNEELKAFLWELDKKDHRFGVIVEMLSNGYTKNEIIASLDLKKSQGYKLINKALEALEVFYKED